MDEVLSELLEQEQKARDRYTELRAGAKSATERELIERIIAQKKFEIETLRLLSTGKVPNRFMGFGMIIDDEVNFREAPSPQALVRAQLSRGTPVIVTERRGNWVGIQLYDGKDGWVFRDYVRMSD
ncbi:MAG: SH3 domain-containing protein [Bacillota bacterium]|jgi:SH3-like domain-containing protein|nr:SH3 domain-containing protein [Candidatus Fermentithermobacillaceae bacterium]